jgi:hypothetical protein
VSAEEEPEAATAVLLGKYLAFHNGIDHYFRRDRLILYSMEDQLLLLVRLKFLLVLLVTFAKYVWRYNGPSKLYPLWRVQFAKLHGKGFALGKPLGHISAPFIIEDVPIWAQWLVAWILPT